MAAPAPAAPAPPAPPVNFNWNGFNTFILNTDLNVKSRGKIIYIFASKLYNCTTLLDYNLRLLNAYVHVLDSTNTGKNIKSNWTAFITNMTTVAEVTTIANKLLVLINQHTDDASGDITIANAYDTNNSEFISKMKTTDTFKASSDETLVAASIKTEVDNIIKKIEKVAYISKQTILFKWNGFDNLFVKVTAADERSYICNYFISELSNANAPDANEDSDAYILFKQLIIENANESHITTLNTAVEKDATLINTLSKNLKYLFEYTDINTSIEKKTVDALKCFGDADTELVNVAGAANAPAKQIPAFDKNTLPAGWQPYNMVNIASYNIAGLDTKPKIDNVIAFLTNISAGKAPEYDKFRPDIITLQNTTELMADSTKYNILITAIESKNYLVFEHEDGTSKKKDKLITLIKSDYFAKSGGKTYTNDPFIGYLDAASNKYYLASVIQKYKIIVINVVDTTGAQIPFTSIKDAVIEPIIKANTKIDISNYDMIITGTINHGDTSPVYVKNYEHSICTYNKADIKDSYIISTGFKDKAVYPYDFSGTGVKFETDYSNSRPIGKRMFQDPAKAPKKATSASSNKSGLKITFTSLLDDIATELVKLSQKQINQILASVSAPNTAPPAPKKKTTSAKATPVATPPKGAPVAVPVATPPKKSAIYIPNITEIDFKAVPGFKLADFTGGITQADYITFNSGGKKFKIKIKTDKGDFDIEEKNILQVNTMPEEFCLKVTDTATPPNDYYITRINITDEFKIDIGGTEHKVPFNTSSKKAPVTPPGTNVDITKLKYITFIDILGFDHTKLADKLPKGYVQISTIKGKFTITLAKGVTANVTENDIYWDSGNKQNFCFKVKVSGADKFITGIKITNKIIIKIGKKYEVVKFGVNK